jgi:hypothetical protein
MLASETALRERLDDLHRKAVAIARHAEYDKTIRIKVDESTILTDALKQEMENFVEVIGELAVARVLGEPFASGDARCQRGAEMLNRLESLHGRLSVIIGETADLLVARADLHTMPIDREALADGLEKQADYLAAIEKSLIENRKRLDDLCRLNPC